MITGLDHVTILVKDWEKTIEQFKTIFDTDQVRYSPQTAGRGYKAAHIDFGNGQNIEIITPTDENGTWAQRQAKQGDGIYLFSLKTDDLEETAAGMRARGVRLPDPIAGLQVIHPSSAGGALVLLSQQ